MATQTKTRRRHEFFKEQKKGYNPDAIMIPDNALALRNNCKEGRWMQDDSTYNKIGNLIDILSKTEEMDKLVDPLMLSEHECVDRLSPQEIVQLAASMNPLVPRVAANSNSHDNAALPQSVVETAAF